MAFETSRRTFEVELSVPIRENFREENSVEEPDQEPSTAHSLMRQAPFSEENSVQEPYTEPSTEHSLTRQELPYSRALFEECALLQQLFVLEHRFGQNGCVWVLGDDPMYPSTLFEDMVASHLDYSYPWCPMAKQYGRHAVKPKACMKNDWTYALESARQSILAQTIKRTSGPGDGLPTMTLQMPTIVRFEAPAPIERKTFTLRRISGEIRVWGLDGEGSDTQKFAVLSIEDDAVLAYMERRRSIPDKNL